MFNGADFLYNCERSELSGVQWHGFSIIMYNCEQSETITKSMETLSSYIYVRYGPGWPRKRAMKKMA